MTTDKRRHAAGEHAPASESETRQAGRRWRLAWLICRWPAGLGLVLGLLMLVDGNVSQASASLLIVLMAVAYPVIGAGRRHLDRPAVLALEIAGILFFGAFVVASLLVDRDVARYLLAAAVLNHAAWDVAHYLADRVVPRPYADFCWVFDGILTAGLLLLP